MKSLYAILALASVTVAPLAHADCTYPPPPTKLPDGNTATMQEMVEAKKSITQYDKDINAYVACIKLENETAIANGGDKLSKEQKADMERMVVQKNNAAVDQLQSVAERFNEQVRIYKAKNNPSGDSGSKK